MAYADDAVKAKLSALVDSQDSIVSVAQWVMFHRRHADRTAELWLERLKESNTSKKLNLVYLANEVVQQSKARKKEDFLVAFSPIIADATATAYKGSTQDVQLKIRRVVEVWRQRGIFETAIQDAVERRIDEIDKSRTARPAAGARLGGSLFGSTSVPSDLQPLVQPQTNLSRAETAARPLTTTANTEYAKMTDPGNPVPTPPVHAARLSSLLKTLASAEGAVNDSMKARGELIAGLEKLLESNRTKLIGDQAVAMDLSDRRAKTEAKKKEVEDGIMRGLSADSFNAPLPGHSNGDTAAVSDGRSPEMESFTPPPPDMETFTPTGSPKAVSASEGTAVGQDNPETGYYIADTVQEQQPTGDEPPPTFDPALSALQATFPSTNAADSLLRSLALPRQSVQTSQSPQPNGAPVDPRLKRRKMSHKPTEQDDDLFAGNDGVGIDSDVAAMLGAQ